MMTHHYDGETNPITKADRELMEKAEITVDWNDPRLGRISRLRLLTDPGFPMWDVSYCYGLLKDGTPVKVGLPFDQLPRRGMREAIVKWAKRDKVYAKGIGIFDALSTLR
jgi:hypothetical protein